MRLTDCNLYFEDELINGLLEISVCMEDATINKEDAIKIINNFRKLTVIESGDLWLSKI